MEREISELLAETQDRGWELDEGNLIAGPFIPDGMYRVHSPAQGVIEEGRDLREVLELALMKSF